VSVRTARKLQRAAKKKGGRKNSAARPGQKARLAAIDSTMLESHHVSRHFEKRCKQSQRQARQETTAGQRPATPGPEESRENWQPTAAGPQSSNVCPSSVGGACRPSHLILAARATPEWAPITRIFHPVALGRQRLPWKMVVGGCGLSGIRRIKTTAWPVRTGPFAR